MQQVFAIVIKMNRGIRRYSARKALPRRYGRWYFIRHVFFYVERRQKGGTRPPYATLYGARGDKNKLLTVQSHE